MSEQPPRASGHVPAPGEVEAEGSRLTPDPEAPPSDAASFGDPGAAPFKEGAGHAHGHAPPAGDGRSSNEASSVSPEERLRARAGTGLDRAADAARRLGHQARQQGGLAGRAEPVAYRVGDSLQSAASYVRTNELSDMRDDVEHGVHRSPLKALVVAAVGGFLLGRLLR